MLAHVRQLCSLDVDSRTAMPALLAALRGWLDFAIGAFFWADAQGRPVAACASDSKSQLLAGRYAAEFSDSGGRWPSLVEMAGRRRLGLVEFGGADREFLGSRLYHELLAPSSVDRVVGASLVSPAGALGVLLLMRGPQERAFCREHQRRLLQSLLALAGALDRPVGRHHFVDDGDSGMLVVAADGALRHACRRGRELLHMAANPGGLLVGAVAESERQQLQRLAQAALLARDGGYRSAATVDNGWGRFHLRAAVMHGSDGDQVGIRLQRQVPAALKMVQSVDGLGLSPRQRELAVLLGCSLQNETIADRLGLRPSTVAGMVKDVYHRVGVNSRHALREMLLQPA